MVSSVEAIALEVRDGPRVGAFWAELLGRQAVAEPAGMVVPGTADQVGLRFITSATEQVGPRRLHLHLTSTSLENQSETVDHILRLGGEHIDVGQDPLDKFVVLADPGGNEICVIEPGNKFLAGTGFLGEVTSEGSRDVGFFWRDALAWPLVWDHGQETAIQSPAGGTKISWDGPPAPKHGRNRQRMDLVAADPVEEAERLVALGATLLAQHDDALELSDVDGNEFGLRPE